MSKYHAIPTVVDGVRFDSRGEARRWQDLLLLKAAGEISGLERQLPYPLTVNGVKIADFYADFRYNENGKWIVEDFKGVRTDVYRLKKRLMLAIYGIEIRESSA